MLKWMGTDEIPLLRHERSNVIYIKKVYKQINIIPHLFANTGYKDDMKHAMKKERFSKFPL